MKKKKCQEWQKICKGMRSNEILWMNNFEYLPYTCNVEGVGETYMAH